MKPRLSALMIGVVALVGTLVLSPLAVAEAAKGASALTVPITGQGPNGTFDGTFTVQKFANQGGQLVAVGTLSGTLTNTATGATQQVSQAVTLPVTVNQASCQILDLTLGPLHLDLLGLVIDLNQVHLTITAQQGPGNLLGNLLCAIAGLLDQNATGTALVNVLNQILALLR